VTFKKIIGTAAVLAIAAWQGRALADNDDEVGQHEAENGRVLSFDHYVNHVSTVPATAGHRVQLFVRERVLGRAEDMGRATEANGKAVLFVHGGTYPSVPDYDLDFKNYNWMVYLARAGFDVYAMDIQGYGWSVRPFPMGDPCNVSAAQQPLISPYPIPASAIPCAPSYPFTVATSQSDWDDVDRVVDFVRARTGQDRINLIGWSGGGPRFGGYAALHPEKVDKVVLLAPGYSRATPDNPPAVVPRPGAAYTVSTRNRAFHERWDIQVHCPNQFDPGIRDVIWATNMKFDPVGATWGPGVVRARTSVSWGWNAKMAAKVRAPILLLSGEFDQEVSPQAVRDLFADVGSDSKVFISIDCVSHYVPYETNHMVLLKSSKEWLLSGSVSGVSRGTLHADAAGRIRKVD
jgi:pimeloyl-ACP methyl ester carboxylesterase